MHFLAGSPTKNEYVSIQNRLPLTISGMYLPIGSLALRVLVHQTHNGIWIINN